MSEGTAHVIEAALRLSATERASVAERLLASLDRPDPQLEAIWAREAEARIAAYDAGRVASVSAEEVIAELAQP